MTGSVALRAALWAAALALVLAQCARGDDACEPSCRLRFCGGRGVALVGAPHTAATPSVCGPAGSAERRAVRRLGRTHLRLRGRRRLRRADHLGFNASLFAPVLAPLRFGGSALALAAPLDRAQRARLHGACAVVTVARWGDRFARSAAARDCVAFRVHMVDVRVDLLWDSRDDLDVFVTQPDGEQVFFQPTSDAGRLLRDDNRRACGRAAPGGAETVVYARAAAAAGPYVASAEHSRSCAQGPTSWRLRVAVHGAVVSDVSGTSRLPLGGLIAASVTNFSVPALSAAATSVRL